MALNMSDKINSSHPPSPRGEGWESRRGGRGRRWGFSRVGVWRQGLPGDGAGEGLLSRDDSSYPVSSRGSLGRYSPICLPISKENLWKRGSTSERSEAHYSRCLSTPTPLLTKTVSEASLLGLVTVMTMGSRLARSSAQGSWLRATGAKHVAQLARSSLRGRESSRTSYLGHGAQHVGQDQSFSRSRGRVGEGGCR